MIEKSKLISKEKTQKQNRIWVRISAACNEKCLFCLDSEAQDWKLIPEESVKKQIREGFKVWYENRLILSWGEASINPKFPLYISYAKELWYDRIQTVTNGGMFAREEFCKKVIDAWLEEITFSLHGHTRELHDFLTWTPWSFNKALRWLIFIKKSYPQVIINIDIVVNKVNVDFLPKIVAFFMKLGIYEYDILQIIPFGRGFSEFKDTLFYTISEHLGALHQTWKLSRVPGMYMWTNRFPAEAFEWYEDLIQDPRKIKSETMGEAYEMFEKFIQSKGAEKPSCFWEQCNVCFLQQYCHDFLDKKSSKIINSENNVLHGEEFPSQVYEKYGEKWETFVEYLKEHSPMINVPKCLSGTGIYEYYGNMDPLYTIEDYTKKYINNLYRKKSTRCKSCKHTNSCEGIHINFIRSYGFSILNPITD